MKQSLLFVTDPKEAGVTLWAEVLEQVQSRKIYQVVTLLGKDAGKRQAIPRKENVRPVRGPASVRTVRPLWGIGASQPTGDLDL